MDKILPENVRRFLILLAFLGLLFSVGFTGGYYYELGITFSGAIDIRDLVSPFILMSALLIFMFDFSGHIFSFFERDELPKWIPHYYSDRWWFSIIFIIIPIYLFILIDSIFKSRFYLFYALFICISALLYKLFWSIKYFVEFDEIHIRSWFNTFGLNGALGFACGVFYALYFPGKNCDIITKNKNYMNGILIKYDEHKIYFKFDKNIVILHKDVVSAISCSPKKSNGLESGSDINM